MTDNSLQIEASEQTHLIEQLKQAQVLRDHAKGLSYAIFSVDPSAMTTDCDEPCVFANYWGDDGQERDFSFDELTALHATDKLCLYARGYRVLLGSDHPPH